MVLSPPDCLSLAFGHDSFQRHLRLAAERHLEVEVRRLPRVALDIDEPGDLALFAAQQVACHSFEVLTTLGLLARLEQEGISPSPEADRRTLLRRLSLDLIGLLPTPSQLQEFLADDSPQSYEHVVDQCQRHAAMVLGEMRAVRWRLSGARNPRFRVDHDRPPQQAGGVQRLAFGSGPRFGGGRVRLARERKSFGSGPGRSRRGRPRRRCRIGAARRPG